MAEHLQEYLGAYMFLALAVLLFTGVPVAFVLGGVALIFGMLGLYLEVVSVYDFYLFVERMWQGAAENLVLVAIPCFIFMGTMLERSKAASKLLNVLQVLMRRTPGGLAVAVTIMGVILAATTGIIGASVVMMTLMALPPLLSQRYDDKLATGTVAASATLGILIPPSIMLVVMADLLSISVGNLFVGAILPGLLLSSLYLIYIVSLCAAKPALAPKLPRADVPEKSKDMFRLIARGFLPPVFLITLVLGSIFGGWATPTEAAGVGALGAILLAWWNGSLNARLLRDVCQQTARTGAMIFLIFLGATSFSYMFRSLYGEDLIIQFIEWLQLGPWGLLLGVMLVVFVLGFFFDWIEITLIVLPVFAPIIADYAPAFANHLGVSELSSEDIKLQTLYWFAVLVAINLQTSFLTPPFGFALFYMKGAAPDSVKMGRIFRGIIPFVLLQLVGLLTVWFWPSIALWLPSILLS